MKDWKLLAKTQDLDFPEEELARVSQVLDGLEQAFTPLRDLVPFETEPAIIFQLPVGEER